MRKYLLVLCIVFVTTGVSAEMYSWEDANGVVHMSTTPPPKSVKNVQTVTEEENDGLPPGKHLYLDILYTRDSFEAEITALKQQINYYQEKCKTVSTHLNRSGESIADYCDREAARTQRSLDILKSEPDRYFYVTKNGGRRVAGMPQYPSWE